MKKILMTLGVLLATVALSGMTAQAETVTVTKVISVPDANKEQVFEKVQTWAGKYSRSYSGDVKSGIVMTSGEITYPSPSVDRIQYTILFEMKNKIHGNKNTVTFEKIMLKSPSQFLSDSNETIAGQASPIKSKKDIAAANKALAHVADNLEAYLLTKSDAACPLMKCPDCGLLVTSPEDLKEHMKGHPGHEPTPMK